MSRMFFSPTDGDVGSHRYTENTATLKISHSSHEHSASQRTRAGKRKKIKNKNYILPKLNDIMRYINVREKKKRKKSPQPSTDVSVKMKQLHLI